MSIEEGLRAAVRDEVRAALREVIAELRAVTAPTSKGDLMTIAQAAAEFTLGASTIRDWQRRGKLNKYGEGRNVRVSRAELERAMAPKPRARPSDADLDARAEQLLREH